MIGVTMKVVTAVVTAAVGAKLLVEVVVEVVAVAAVVVVVVVQVVALVVAAAAGAARKHSADPHLQNARHIRAMPELDGLRIISHGTSLSLWPFLLWCLFELSLFEVFLKIELEFRSQVAHCTRVNV
jgi:hypothetical protein